MCLGAAQEQPRNSKGAALLLLAAHGLLLAALLLGCPGLLLGWGASWGSSWGPPGGPPEGLLGGLLGLLGGLLKSPESLEIDNYSGFQRFGF